MIAATEISIAFGSQQVLDGVSLTIDGQSRTGLVGANGSGKTTLLKILAGVEPPEKGEVSRAKELRIAYLPQRLELPPDRTVYDVAESGFEREQAMLSRREAVADALKGKGSHEELLTELAQLDHDLEESGFYAREPVIARVLRGLGFRPEDNERPLREFSGGWRMRAVLARTLLVRPDILLLDEPTNYLDTEARLWLSGFLRSFPGGVLMVSHDRAFLDDTVTEILELFLGQVRRYRGTYSSYEAQRAAELSRLTAAWEHQRRELAKQEDFIRRFRAKASKAKQVQSRIRMVEKTQRIEIPEHLRPITVTLPPATHSGRAVVEVIDLSKSYDGENGADTAKAASTGRDSSPPVLDSVSFVLQRGSRLAVLGRNGAGKSTLLRILAERDSATKGTAIMGRDVKIAYFGQDTPDTLPADATVLEYASAEASTAAQPLVRDVLGAFLFSGDSVEKPLSVLSGGERSRLAMATLLLRPANFLVLDEPTNHLDMTSQQVLAKALGEYDGTVVLVSHDRHFLRKVATDVLALWPRERRIGDVPPRGWQLYPGSFKEFEESGIGRVFEESRLSARPPGAGEAGDAGKSPLDDGAGRPAEGSAENFQAQKAQRAEVRRLKKKEEELLQLIEKLESERTRLQAELAEEYVYRDPEAVKTRQAALLVNESEQAEAHAEWEVALQQLEVLDPSEG